ncbi:MAG: DUF4065 domain-containing protein [Propionibacterium sp.]|nr:DUF4065 domain-containing protein [Propionibacterium sp.]
MHRANDIANWFLAWADANDAEISNLKMQKLLYYAQGHSLRESGSLLFQDQIQAWAHGPVVPSLYHRFKAYGKLPIDADAEVPDGFDWDDFQDAQDLLMRVWNTYGSQEAWALRNKTHHESPWIDAFNSGEHNCVITAESMRDFFVKA